MLEAGIIDPAKVTRSAVENACSIAAMILDYLCTGHRYSRSRTCDGWWRRHGWHGRDDVTLTWTSGHLSIQWGWRSASFLLIGGISFVWTLSLRGLHKVIDVMKRISQYELDIQSLNGTIEDSHFEMKLIDKIADNLSWLWEWQHALYHVYSKSILETLVNGSSRIYAVPALAYIRVEDITYRGYTGR